EGQVAERDIGGFTEPIAKHAQTVAKRIRPFRAEHTNHRHGRLLRACRERPKTRRHGRRAAEQRYELAALHSITSSARASSIGGASRPSAFAVLTLRASSNFVGCSTGRSAGFSPLRMRPT